MKKKTAQHLLLLEPQQKKEWKRKASEAGMTLNRYIRNCVEKRRITVQTEVNLKLIVQLSRIANNLNQQTKAIHTALRSGENPDNWNENLQAVEETMSLLRQIQAELMGLRDIDREDYEG